MSPSTLLVLNLPANILFGIDLLSLSTSATFQGISEIPPGWHFIFTAATASLSVRHGFWFQTSKSRDTIIRKWDAKREEVVESTRDEEELWKKRLGGSEEEGKINLLPYDQLVSEGASSPQDSWLGLTEHITSRLLSRLTAGIFIITSTSCAAQDREEIPGLSREEIASVLGKGEGEGALEFLGIELGRTWREGAVGRERTEGARDRSWALGDVIERNRGNESALLPASEQHEYNKWGHEVLGEMEVCFLMVLTLSNYSCLQEWKRILNLVLTSRAAIVQHPTFFSAFLGVLRIQLVRSDEVEGGLFDFTDTNDNIFLKKLLKSFKMTLEETVEEDLEINKASREEVMAEMKTLEDWVEREYGWNMSDSWVRRGMVRLEDGEEVEVEVEEGEGEDERGEYAPVIVDLGD
ncbi:MAG: hypothetical protein MMC33_000807 [Icmadophila ericetorum]|nr:hypothetical protein [Icmadophila ericetorum]